MKPTPKAVVVDTGAASTLAEAIVKLQPQPPKATIWTPPTLQAKVERPSD